MVVFGIINIFDANLIRISISINYHIEYVGAVDHAELCLDSEVEVPSNHPLSP